MTDNDIPQDAQEQIRKAVDTALAKPAAAQGFLNNIPDINLGELKDKVVSGIDTAVGLIDSLLGYAWLIPDQYEAPLAKLRDALTKVKGWIS